MLGKSIMCIAHVTSLAHRQQQGTTIITLTNGVQAGSQPAHMELAAIIIGSPYADGIFLLNKVTQSIRTENQSPMLSTAQHRSSLSSPPNFHSSRP